MKRIFLLLIVICTYQIVSSQDGRQFTTVFGNDREIELPKNNVYERFIGADANGFYAIRLNEKNDIFLDFFNTSTMQKESSNQLILPIIEGMPSKYIEMFYLDRNLILFFEVENNMNREKTLYAQQVGSSCNYIGEPTPVARLSAPNTGTKFNVELTENQQNMFIYYNRPFQTYNNEPFFMKVYNSNLKEIFNSPLGQVNAQHTEFVKLPLEGRNFTIVNTKISNTGNVYMIAKLTIENKKAKKPTDEAFEYKFIVYNAPNREVIIKDLASKKFVLDNVIMGIDNNENVDIYGFLLKKGKDIIDGIFHQRFDFSTKDFIKSADPKKADYVFSKGEIPAFRADRLSKVYSEIYNYKFLNVVYLSNGASAVIAEHKNYWVDSIIVPGSKEIIFNDYYRYNDVIVTYCGPDNNMEWSTRIPKSQYSYNDLARFSSVASFAVGEAIYLIYNDNSKNIELQIKDDFNGEKVRELNSPDRNGTATCIRIFSDGKPHGDYLFLDKKNKRFKVVPEFVKEYNLRRYIYTQNGNKIKFCEFTGN